MNEDLVSAVSQVVRRLTDPANAEPAASFPRDRTVANQPGLYSWWADDDALDVLSWPFGRRLTPMIYAGQAGATSSWTRTVRTATLQSRIGGNHLNGNIGSSTFRRTLTAILLEPLSLRLAGPNALDAISNQRLSTWMRQHLSLVIAPFSDRATLGRLEETVLGRLDPPLNLMGVPASPVRTRLSDLRTRLAAPTTAAAIARDAAGSGVTRPGRTAPPDPETSIPRAVSGPPAARTATLTLHEAMVEVLRGRGWMSYQELAQRIAARDLYRRRDGGYAEPGQLRLRATQSGGRYSDLFDVDGPRIRLRSDRA